MKIMIKILLRTSFSCKGKNWRGGEGALGRYMGGVLYYYSLRWKKIEFSLIFLKKKEQSICYTYKIWCAETVKEQPEEGMSRHYQEEVCHMV